MPMLLSSPSAFPHYYRGIAKEVGEGIEAVAYHADHLIRVNGTGEEEREVVVDFMGCE